MKKIYQLLFVLYIGSVNAQNLSSGLKACYPLDNNAQNYSPIGAPLNGVLHNVSSTTGHNNLANTAYCLVGDTGSYIKLPDHPGIKSDSVFFSGWFRIDSLPSMNVSPSLQYLVYTTNGCMSNFEAYSLHMYYDFSVSQYVFCLTKSDNTCSFGKPQIFSTTAPAPGNWYHICFYITNSVMKLWVNGTLQSSINHSTPFSYLSGYNVFLGVTNQSNFDYPFKGAIDNVRFYSRELSQQEITQLYTQEPACSESLPTSILNGESSVSSISVYPNPTIDKIYVENLGGNDIEVLDLLGRSLKIARSNECPNVIELVLEDAIPGVYFVRISDPAGNYLGSVKLISTK